MKFVRLFPHLSDVVIEKIVEEAPGKAFLNDSYQRIGTVISAVKVGPEDMNTIEFDVELNDLGKSQHVEPL